MDGKAPSNSTVYRGTICDQTVRTNSNHELQVVLTVTVDAAVHSDQSGNAVTDPVDPVDRYVYLTISSNEDRLRIAMQQLSRLGFNHDDLARLHPDHEEFQSLVGREVFVVPRTSGERTYWNLWWPRSKAVDVQRIRELQQPLQSKIAAIQNEYRSAPITQHHHQATGAVVDPEE
jgi:hypothetical protein